MTNDKISIGVITPIYWALMIILTGAVTFLDIVPTSVLIPVFVVFGLGGIILVLVTGKLGMVNSENRFGLRVVISIALTMGFLAISSWVLWNFGSMTIAIPDNTLVAVLFAIYEETMFLGVAAVLKLTGLNDIFIIVISTLIFIPLHAWAYSSTWLIDLTLAIGRIGFSAFFFISDNSDVPYTSHILWNILATV